MTRLLLVAFAVLCVDATAADLTTTIDSYIQPYVQTNNFAGAVLIERGDDVLLEKTYGFANRKRQVLNNSSTQFHIASVSMQFTAAAVLRLVDDGAITLDSPVAKYAREISGARKITIRDLLDERSGLPDINALPEYNEILQHHQTAASLIEKISGHPLLFEPGSKFLHEEHSAYNLLALIIERETKLPFAAAMQQLVFRRLGLTDSFIDDDLEIRTNRQARGYQPAGVYEVEPAPDIHWSGKTGNGSVCTTTGDEAKWVRALFTAHALNRASQNIMLDSATSPACGWFKAMNKRLGETAYYMNGRSPGFASFVLYLPKEALTVIVFGNVYSSVTTTIGYDIAAIVLGLPYQMFRPAYPPPNAADLASCAGTFQFGPEFYQPNAKVQVSANGSELDIRWTGGSLSPLIPISRDHFVDRTYWEPVVIEREPSGNPSALIYGEFRGAVVSAGRQ